MTDNGNGSKGDSPKPGWESVGKPGAPEPAPPEPAERVKLPAAAWEKLEGETSVAFEAFCIYRDKGPARSNAKVAQALGKSKQIVDRWSSRWRWVDRADVWDLNQDREWRAELRDQRRSMAKRHAESASQVIEFAIKQLKAKIKKAKSDDDKLEIILSNQEVLRFIVEGTKLERLAFGEPETISGQFISGGPVDDPRSDEPRAIPVTFAGRLDEVMGLLETARTRKNLDASSEPDTD